VMTDLRETSSTLVLGEGQYGRFYVLDSDRQLVAELHKALGRRVELGVEPGRYDVFVEQDATRRTASVTLADGERRELTTAELRATKLLPSRRRGPEDQDDLLDGRVRAQLGATVWNDISGSGGRYSVLHWNKPWLAYEFSFGTGQFVASGTDILLGARYYPALRGRLRPYAGLLLGRAEVVDVLGTPPRATERGQFAAALPAGVDVFFGRHFVLDLGTRTTLAGGGWHDIELFVAGGFMFGGRSRK